MSYRHSIRRISIILTVVIATGFFGVAAWAANRSSGASSIFRARTALAKYLGLPIDYIKVIETCEKTWPDSSLGLQKIGKVYAQVVSPGRVMVLEAKGVRYLYTASSRSIAFGGPVDSWSYSVLYTVPIPNEPNLNGELYQCSLLGTNPYHLASGVSEIYPQSNGAILFTRRTSRSGFDLFLLHANQPDRARKLFAGFAFSDVALNDAQDLWAGIVRPRIMTPKSVMVANVSGSGSSQTLGLPDGVDPTRIAWSGSSLMILAKKDHKTLCYEIDPKAEKPEWKETAGYLFPKTPDLVLSKSQSLEISQIAVDDKPVVEIARVWFTGDRNVVAQIKGLTLRGYDLAGPFAFVWGEKDGKTASYTTNIRTGKVMAGPSDVQSIRLFRYPSHDSPLKQ